MSDTTIAVLLIAPFAVLVAAGFKVMYREINRKRNGDPSLWQIERARVQEKLEADRALVEKHGKSSRSRKP